MEERMIGRIEFLAKKKTFFDREGYESGDLDVGDCLGHGQDCYERGLEDGAVELARELLDMIIKDRTK